MHGAALMHDQVEGLRRRGVAAEYLCHTQSREKRSEIFAEMKREGVLIKFKLLFITPELVRPLSHGWKDHFELTHLAVCSSLTYICMMKSA